MNVLTICQGVVVTAYLIFRYCSEEVSTLLEVINAQFFSKANCSCEVVYGVSEVAILDVPPPTTLTTSSPNTAAIS